MWVFAILAVLLIGAVAVVGLGGGGAMQPAIPDRADSVVPAERMLTARDLRQVRFAIGVRGYRMDEVDSLLDRLAEELAVREAWETRVDTGTSGVESDPGSGRAWDEGD